MKKSSGQQDVVWVKNLFEFMKMTATARPGSGQAVCKGAPSHFWLCWQRVLLSVACPLHRQEHFQWHASRVLSQDKTPQSSRHMCCFLLGSSNYAFAKHWLLLHRYHRPCGKTLR